MNFTKLLRLFPTGCALVCAACTASSSPAAPRPNILLILADDLGFSDIGCYGGEIKTPNLDALAAKGLRFTRFYNCARCCPSRAALMTGLYPHQAGIGDMVDEYARRVRETLNTPAYSDHLNPHTPTIAEALRAGGYRTGMTGKWHLGYRPGEWPTARGFDRSFALIEGAMNYYGFGMQHTGIITNPPMALDREVFIPPREDFFATDAFSDYAVRWLKGQAGREQPFFFYLAYTAPHWPLHAKPEDIAKHRGQYRAIGWDKLREQRCARLKASGIIDPRWALAPRPANLPAWDQLTPGQQEIWDEKMSVYAAQVEEMDHGIGRVLTAVRDIGAATNTLVLFLSDNGGAAENPKRGLPGAALGTRESFEGYAVEGAHVSSGPFRKTKRFTHEGGVATPLIACWPAGITVPPGGRLIHDTGHLIDLMPTCLELAGATLPGIWNAANSTPLEGASLAPAFRARPVQRSNPLFWEHEGQRAVRSGKWKLVSSFNEPWELYDMESDRTELHDLTAAQPGQALELATQYEAWAARVGVKPWPAPAPASPKKAPPPKAQGQ